jgi:ATP-dependent protease HslVU (ClpYQ) peptidase subunit
VWIGGDSSLTAGCDRFTRFDDELKVFRLGDMVIGCSGAIRVAQVLQHHVKLPGQSADNPDESATEYLIRAFMPVLQEAFTSNAGIKLNDSHEGWALLIGYRKQLYYIGHDLAVVRSGEYEAIGCGQHYAIGALYATKHLVISPRDRIEIALEAAAENDIHVEKPFTIMSLEAEA